ncbi:von Willebrand factor A domain-containing protein 3B [Latimeria chalumnae]|uniref:von Willebrand factor A domain-containing protein 3B n=1 Tax=Latimeria chalumnae TaxID=7897 RepID=UPI00313ECBF6
MTYYSNGVIVNAPFEVTFDLMHKGDPEMPNSHDFRKSDQDQMKGKKVSLSETQFELDVQTLISSTKWLQHHGLMRNRLTLSQILSQIGFKHREDYVYSLGKPVSSRYAEGLFPQYMKNGNIYNVSLKEEKLLQFADSLTRAIKLYKQRLEWLTSGSQQIFGIIQEHCIAIVLDFGIMPEAQFNLCRDAICMVLREQVSQVAKFNLIRAAKDMAMWQEKAVHVTKHTIESAIDWTWTLEHMSSTSKSSTVEAILQAMSDKTIEAVYFFAAGDVPESMKELLCKKLSNSPCPIHTVSFNAKEEGTITFLKKIAHLTAGRFHAFAETTDQNEWNRSITIAGSTESLAPQIPRKLKGGLPPGTGVREDVFLIWREMEEARNTLAQIEALSVDVPLPSSGDGLAIKSEHPVPLEKQTDCLSSEEWLQIHGLKARKLTLYDALADCAFRHSDGVVDVKAKPADENLQTDADKKNKLVNAKYCDRFAHTQWKDGSIVHVYITTEKCRVYEERMKTALEHMERRVAWLQQGSRELFGTILEDQVYVLVDTSQSMKDRLPLVKERIFQLMQEQLRHKSKFNFVKFGSRAVAWRDTLAEVNESNLENAWFWVKGLQVGGSTNTLAALRLALADAGTQAVYLLTDGRPDQPPKTILAQVQLREPVLVHTISFNCDDIEANKFLHELSKETGGRFHCYGTDGKESDGPQPFVSEDIYLLKKEIEQGRKDLEKVQRLHAECIMLDWYHNGGKDPREKYDKYSQKWFLAPHWSTSYDQEHGTLVSSKVSPTPSSHSSRKCFTNLGSEEVGFASSSHTKSSLLRTLNNSMKPNEDTVSEWILPETEELFINNFSKEAEILNEFNLTKTKPTQKKAERLPKNSLDISSARWLKTHGLVARRLTIMDALAPTAVPQTAKYVPILDKHVVSKVFDKVLPLAHVSNSVKRITLINPQAVNLDSYKEKLERVMKSYERRLNLVAWRALTQEERDKFGSEEPISFMEHKEGLLQALDRLGWPIPPEDVTLLEDEIQTGKTYLQQASDLQEATKQRASKSNYGSEEIKHHDETSTARKQKIKVLDNLRNQRVIARSEVDGFYYPGIVTKRINSKTALVDFSQGDTQITPTRFLIPLGGAIPCPPLKVGDFVFVRTRTETENDCYAPAVVIATPRRVEAAGKFYTVLKYNNRKEHCLRNGIIKVSRSKYAFACRYIREAQMIDHTIASVQFAKPIPKKVPQEEEKRSTTDEDAKSKGKGEGKKVRKKYRKKKNSSDSENEDQTSVSGSEIQRKQRTCSSEDIRQEDQSDSENEKGISLYHMSSQSTSGSSIAPSQHSSRTGTPLSCRISTPIHSISSAATSTRHDSPEHANIPKLKELADQLHQALTEHREQQEKMQEYLKDLENLKALHNNSKILEEQKELAEQQAELVERLEKLNSFDSSRKYNTGNMELYVHPAVTAR